MAKITMGGGRVTMPGPGNAEAGTARFMIVATLIIFCTITTALTFSRSPGLVSYQLFFIPILYVTYFFPRKGLIVAGLCGIIYQAIGYYYRFPDPAALISVTSEAVLFVIIAFLITFFIERIREGEVQYRSVFEHSQLGILIIDQTDFVIRRTNEKISAILHRNPEELKKMAFTSLFFDEPERDRFLDSFRKSTDHQDFETRLRTQAGDICWVNLSWSGMGSGLASLTLIDINARKRAEKANHVSMLKYQQLTENSPTGILVIRDKTIVFSNPAFSHFSGHSPGELLEKNIHELIEHHDREGFVSFIENIASGGPVSIQKEFRFVTKSGEIRTAVVFANSLPDNGRQAAMINIMDISVQQRLEEKIHQDNERRRGIIITVAHELRTPLQPILGYLNLLIQDPQSFGILDDTKRMLERCLASVERERQIINQMLDLSVLESGRLHLSYSNFLIVSLVNSVLDAGGYPSKSAITVDLPQDLIVTADMDRLYSVLDSLLENAVNYSKPPRKITISCHPGTDGAPHRISVEDNGIGIAPEMYSSIFEPFQLADAVKLSRKYERLGLSLSIAKKVMQMHGGDITVESVINTGSIFTVHLPSRRPDHD